MGEKDRATPREAWETFQKLTELERQQIGDEICDSISKTVTDSVVQTLSADMSTLQKRVSEVEVLLETTHDEMFLYSYPNVRLAAQALLGLLTDRPDVKDQLR